MASFIRLESLGGSSRSFGLLLATRGGYPHVFQSDVHFLVMGREKSFEFDLSLYALKRGHGLLFV